MASPGFALFSTSIGACGIAWGERGIIGLQLPETGEAATRTRVRQRFPEAHEAKPPSDVKRTVESIVALLRGEAIDLSRVVLDMDGVPPFHARVYELARTIPPGSTLAYGELAKRLGSPGSARAVGQAMGKNPFPIVVPCHRVLAAGGKAGGFTANGGVSTKMRMLSIEGAAVATAATAQRTLFDDGAGYGFDPATAIAHLRDNDAALARVIDAVGPFALDLQATSSVFRALAQAIVYQQLTGKAAATIFGRVCALFPRAGNGFGPEHILRTPDEKLRAAGLSGSKLLSLQDLARKAKAGEIPTLEAIQRMDDEAVIDSLTHVRGIGRWTAEMLLIFRLGRPDVLPLDDYGVRKGLAAVLKKQALPSKKDLAKRGERWRPYRTVASWFLWRAAERAAKG